MCKKLELNFCDFGVRKAKDYYDDEIV